MVEQIIEINGKGLEELSMKQANVGDHHGVITSYDAGGGEGKKFSIYGGVGEGRTVVIEKGMTFRLDTGEVMKYTGP